METYPPQKPSLNALSGIGGVQTELSALLLLGEEIRLNALSGIGGVQTEWYGVANAIRTKVLMPCRALEAFRRRWGGLRPAPPEVGLNALSGIGGVQTLSSEWSVRPGTRERLNALSGIGGVQTFVPPPRCCGCRSTS